MNLIGLAIVLLLLVVAYLLLTGQLTLHRFLEAVLVVAMIAVVVLIVTRLG